MRIVYIPYMLSLLCFSISHVNAQATWQTRFVFEFFRDDTSLVKTYDTLWIGLDARGDKGFQDSLDYYVDSSENIHAYFVDTAFYAQFQSKKLVTDIRRFPDKVGLTSFWCFIDKAPTTIYYDTNTIQLYIPPFLTTIWGEGPLGSSIGAWHSNSVTFLLMNNWYRRSFPAYSFYEIPNSFFFNFKILISDSLKVGVNNPTNYESLLEFDWIANKLTLTSNKPIKDASIEISEMSGISVLNHTNLAFEESFQLSLDALSAGIYLAVFRTPHSIQYKKFYKP